MSELSNLSTNGISVSNVSLPHVRWVGGAPDAGKTSVAKHLAQKYHLQLYHLDQSELAHIERVAPELQPNLASFVAMSVDERWVPRAPVEMADQIVKTGAERFAMVVDDLLAMPKEPKILVEGPWLFPELVAPILTHPHHAVWLVPTEAFKRGSAARRDKPSIRYETSNPERATQNWFQRDLLLAKHVRQCVQELGLTLYDVDGSRSVEQMAAIIEEHFALDSTPSGHGSRRDAT